MTTVFADFRPFFNAMIKKMRANDKKKGDSWKDELWYDPTKWAPNNIKHINNELRASLKKETREYFESLNADELPDIANFCAMLYMRKKRLYPDQN